MGTDALTIITGDHSTHINLHVKCSKEFKKMGITEAHLEQLGGKRGHHQRVEVAGAFDDHDKLAPNVIERTSDSEGIRVYRTADTVYRRERLRPVIQSHPQIDMPGINGGHEMVIAAEVPVRLVWDAESKLAIASHF
jgi:hypothetical protein